MHVVAVKVRMRKSVNVNERLHDSSIGNYSRMAQKYTCSVCYAFSAPNYRSVIRHIGSVHSWEPRFKIICGVDGCPRSYTSYRSFRKHIIDKHQEILADEEASTVPAAEDDDFFDGSIPSQSPVLPGQLEPNNKALFLLKLKEERRISQANVDRLIDDISVLVQDEIRSLRGEILSCIQHGLSTEDSTTMIKQIFDKKLSTSPFVGLESACLQRKYYIEHFNLVVCCLIVCIILYLNS